MTGLTRYCLACRTWVLVRDFVGASRSCSSCVTGRAKAERGRQKAQRYRKREVRYAAQVRLLARVMSTCGLTRRALADALGSHPQRVPFLLRGRTWATERELLEACALLVGASRAHRHTTRMPWVQRLA